MWPTSGAKAVPLVGAALRDVIGQRKLHSTAESIRPFVLLMGWLGADAHNLAKYASLYEDYGAQVSTVRPTLAQTAIPLLSDAATLRAARHIAEEMRSHGEGPLFVQCMSNAGWIAFANLMRMCSLTAGAQTRGEAALPRRLRHAADRQALSELHKALTQTSGIVIDSAPSLATPHIWARGAVAALLRKPAQHVEVENQRMVSVAYSAAERYLALPSVSHHLRDVREHERAAGQI